MKINFEKLNTNKKEIEVKADTYKSAYYDVESVRINGIEISPKIFTSLDEIKIGTANTKPVFTNTQLSTFAELKTEYIKYADYEEVRLEDLYKYLSSKEINSSDNLYKIKVTNLPSSLFCSYDAVVDTLRYILLQEIDKDVSILLPNNVTEIGDYAFKGCQNLVSIIIPKSVTKIGYGAFYDSGLSSIVIPNSVTEIEGDAFRDTYFESITIPTSVTSIDTNALHDSGYGHIIYEGTMEQFNALNLSWESLVNRIITCSDGEIDNSWSD